MKPTDNPDQDCPQGKQLATSCMVLEVVYPSSTSTSATCTTTNGCDIPNTTTTETIQATDLIEYPEDNPNYQDAYTGDVTDDMIASSIAAAPLQATPLNSAPPSESPAPWVLNMYSDTNCQDFVASATTDNLRNADGSYTCAPIPGPVNSYQFVAESTGCTVQGRGGNGAQLLDGDCLSGDGVGGGCGFVRNCVQVNGGTARFITNVLLN